MDTISYECLLDEHRALLAHYGRAQSRCTDLLLVQAREIKHMQAQIVRLRGQAVVRQSALMWEWEDRAAAGAEVPGLPRRRVLARQVDVLVARIQDLAREVLHWQWRAGAAAAGGAMADAIGVTVELTQRVDPAGAVATAEAAGVVAEHTGPSPSWAQARGASHGEVVTPGALKPARSVLCIGQDASGALVTQRMVESALGLASALHAAGDVLQDAAGDIDAALEASLVAADLVICQTGCVGHNAYWRVQDHCRRTGKTCVLVDQPQVMQFTPTAAAQAR